MPSPTHTDNFSPSISALPSLKTHIAKLPLDSYLFNASGPRCTTEEELNRLAGSASAAIMTKSCTMLPREGNAEPRFQALPLGSIQSMGLPNLGYEAYLEMLPRLKQARSSRRGKPIVVSVSGFSISDNVTMVQAFQASSADLIEVNFSCPNIEGKPQVGYDFEQTERALEAICQLGSKPIGLKLPPYFDFSHFITMANIIKKFPVSFITCINSVGNTLVIDPETESAIIKPKGGFGGLCGDYIKPIGLANVRAFSQLLPSSIDIIGVGGIKTGTDAFEYLLAGASAVQVATCFEKEGVECFDRIAKELGCIMAAKQYSSIAAVKGKLKMI
ncbi:dihydroorotate oxidase B, catalytic subunit [Shewanella psychrophila]|uniref:dihydroorotate oxidase (fumarate) n=1 Tax=Shewanella psychrophila TaxID=225848 RepID=A0A1S6HV66_9GAMM|nr:dihydroorotate oxidase [Shewanella psychrophila]AQS39318.1 dihydroorotate oxidase B, catalytic subunit [Shewanella psychrophila]